MVRVCPYTSRDVHLAYQQMGDPTSPAVLLVHGLASQALWWDEGFCQKFLDAGYQVIRFDNREHGLSTKMDGLPQPPVWKPLVLPRRLCPEGPYPLKALAEDAVALIDVLGIEKAHFVGSSMGGMIVQLIAIHFPQRIASMHILCSMSGNRSIPDPPLWARLRILKSPKSQSDEDILSYYVSQEETLFQYRVKNFDRDWAADRYALLHKRAPVYHSGSYRCLYALLHAQSRDGDLATLSKVPTLVVAGATDVVINPLNAYHMAGLIPGAKLLILPDMSHSIVPQHSNTIASAALEVMTRAM